MKIATDDRTTITYNTVGITGTTTTTTTTSETVGRSLLQRSANTFVRGG